MAMGDHGCRWLVTPAEIIVLVVLVVPTGHEQDCGAYSQGSRVELYVCNNIRQEIKHIRCYIPWIADEVRHVTLFAHGGRYSPERVTASH